MAVEAAQDTAGLPDADAGAALSRLAAIATQLGSTTLAAEAERAADRIREGRFYLACVGQFKRGKSTLINALVGAPILPTAVIPVTAVVTVVRYGPRLTARVRFGARDWETVPPASLAAYVSEEQNPGNEKGVTAVEVFVPSPLLESGMCLVDTPGVGSVWAANSEVTRAFVPHIDAALVVLGADPPISGEELSLIEDLSRSVATTVLVLNKADRQSETEREQAAAFAHRVFAQRLSRPLGPIFQVSALERATGTGPSRDWDHLVGTLGSLAAGAGADIVQSSERREVTLLAARLGAEITEQRNALRRPLEETETRLTVLRRAVESSEGTLRELAHRLAAVQERLEATFTSERDRFFDEARPHAEMELDRAIAQESVGGPALRQRAIDHAVEIAKRWLNRWREEQEPRAEALYREGVARFAELVDQTRESLAGVPEFHSLPRRPPETGFRARSGFFYSHMMSATPSSALDWLLDTTLGRWRTDTIRRAARGFLRRFLEVNSARMKNDFVARVVESRRLVERDIREGLEEIVGSVERALDRARAARTEGREAVQSRLEWLDTCEGQVGTVATGS